MVPRHATLICLVALAASAALARATTEQEDGAKAHADSLRSADSRRILADTSGASLLPRWGADPSVAACALDATWDDLILRRTNGTGATFETGGLWGLMEAPRFEVWLCEDGHACANGTSSFFCFVYDEVRGKPTFGLISENEF
ncbi:hypothetical protein T484DRAFT_1867986 [Baffinella frigidus]|nr:hypothetical protein T484DRAFT_1867986 [Cryptophyta sp. CCMP2293]